MDDAAPDTQAIQGGLSEREKRENVIRLAFDGRVEEYEKFCRVLEAFVPPGTTVVLRGFVRMLQETNLFVVLAVAGLLIQFGLQALINMGSTLHLIPTKGMTLPFISYGGSSLLALAIGMGMVLALTRRRFGAAGALQ